MPKVIAIIDDEQEMEFLYQLMLEDAIDARQIELKFFSDSREFTEWFKHHAPDLVMTDMNMPYLSGTEISKIIRDAGRGTPIYMVSGYEEREYAEVMKELNINRFLEKPLDYDSLIGMIEQDLGISGASPQ